MSGTYTAWNGEERPWPPPENWYRAADGRWWHPAYGPDDAPDDRPESLPVWDVSNQDPDVAETGQEAAAVADVDAETSPTPATSPEREPEPKSEREPEPARQSTPERAPEPESEREQEPDPEPGPLVADPVATPARGRRPWVAGALISAVVLGAAALAQFVLAGSDDDVTVSPDGPVAVTGDALTTVTSTDASSTDASSGVSSSFPAETEIDSGDADTGGTDMASDADPEVAATIADFRRQMSEHGLSTAELTDEQITTFAATYCVYAGGAEDRAAFDELRRLAVASSRSSLTPTQLNLTITTAVVVFCPDESERLGITFDG